MEAVDDYIETTRCVFGIVQAACPNEVVFGKENLPRVMAGRTEPKGQHLREVNCPGGCDSIQWAEEVLSIAREHLTLTASTVKTIFWHNIRLALKQKFKRSC